MRYYKDTNNKLYVDPILKNHVGLIEISKKEFDLLLEPTREELKRTKETKVRKTFKQDTEEPVEVAVDSGVFIWNGGVESARLIIEAVELAKRLSEDVVWITDVDNVAHPLSIEDVYKVATAVGLAHRTAFFKKQSALVEINKGE